MSPFTFCSIPSFMSFLFFTLWLCRQLSSSNFIRKKSVEASVLEIFCKKMPFFCVLFINSNRSYLFTHTNWLTVLFGCFAYAMVCIAFYAIFFHLSKRLCSLSVSVEWDSYYVRSYIHSCYIYMGSCGFRQNQCCQFHTFISCDCHHEAPFSVWFEFFRNFQMFYGYLDHISK